LLLNIKDVADCLIAKGVVTHTHAVNTTAMQYQLWKDGYKFDFSKSQTQIHRARLRRIGIDIAKPYDPAVHDSIELGKPAD